MGVIRFVWLTAQLAALLVWVIGMGALAFLLAIPEIVTWHYRAGFARKS